MSPPALLCDLDGVLVDSGAVVERVWRAWAARQGLTFADVRPWIHGMPSAQAVATLVPSADAVAESAWIEREQTIDTDGVRAVAGAAKLLEGWPQDRIAIVTSATRALATARLRAADLRAPRTMVTAELVDRGKPDPEGYLLAASLLDVSPSDCVVLEDAPAGVRAGRDAGMRVIGVTTTHTTAELAPAAEFVADLAEVWAALVRPRN